MRTEEKVKSAQLSAVQVRGERCSSKQRTYFKPSGYLIEVSRRCCERSSYVAALNPPPPQVTGVPPPVPFPWVVYRFGAVIGTFAAPSALGGSQAPCTWILILGGSALLDGSSVALWCQGGLGGISNG